MSPPDIQIEVFGKTDVGLIREHNEDNLLVADLGGKLRESDLDAPQTMPLGDHGALFLVCDGMGGAAAGEVASQMAVDAIFDVLASTDPQPRDGFARSLRHAVEVANERIFQQSRDNQNERGMGTTCTAAGMIDETLVVAQIGDSRCYVFRNGRLGQVTKDQSLAWQLIEAGAMTPEDAKAFEHANIILQALGVQDRVDVVLSQVSLRRGDVVVLCSDGLHGPVLDQEIQEILTAETDLKRAGEALLQKALERDGPDNITVVLARVDGAGLAAPSPDDVVGFVSYEPGRDPVLETGPTPTPEIPQRGSSRVTGSAVPIVTGAEKSGETSGRAYADTEKTVKGRARAAGQSPSAVAANVVADITAKVKDLLGMTNRDPDSPSRSGRSVMALFFLALLAAAASGIFVLKCERDQAVRSQGPTP
jgi:serine/threonine protein phosphatase PrpC